MNDRSKGAEQSGITPGDIYYVLFRHKWKIIVLSAIGILGAAGLWIFWPTPYQSDAKLFIRYVQESKPPTPAYGTENRVKTVDVRGESIIASEMEILTSLDVAITASSNLTDEIRGKLVEGGDIMQAAGRIRNHLEPPEVAKGSSVIRVVYKNRDSSVVQPVLTQLVNAYLKSHAEIHERPEVYDDFFRRQTELLKQQLKTTEDKLRDEKAKADVVSIQDTERNYDSSITTIRQALFNAQSEYVERSTALEEMLKVFPSLDVDSKPTAGTNTNTKTNLAEARMPEPVPPKKVAEYKALCRQLEDLNTREQNLLTTFTMENKMVKAVAEQIEEKEKKKEQLEEAFPALTAVNVASGARAETVDPLLNRRMEFIAEKSKVAALKAKIETYQQQLLSLRTNVADVISKEGTITDLERTRKLQEQQYLYYQANLDQVGVDKQLAAVSTSNISQVQKPSPANQDPSKLHKAALGVLAGFIGSGFALAFLIEFYLDPSCRRPIEIESKLGIPLFLSIPRTKLNGTAQLTGKAAAMLTAGNGAAHANGVELEEGQTGHVDLAPWDPRHLLQPYYEALRDRLIAYFDARNLTHKPKLVAVTSCDEGAGVTTVAAGLAASLSETGDGNVLLVDMNEEHGSTHQFYKGDLACALDDALELEKREGAMVADNLYVVSEANANDKLPRALPKRFKSLVPKLRASDYDYIIFDMPPVSQISVTPRLARFMDMVLMVVESERTDRELVKRASALMADSKTNLGVVLNKGRAYVPKRFLQDL